MGIFDFFGTIGSGWLSDRFDNRWLLYWQDKGCCRTRRVVLCCNQLHRNPRRAYVTELTFLLFPVLVKWRGALRTSR
jgi:hypothetical protein